MTQTELRLDRTLKAPRKAVWAAWSDPNHLAQWWTPKPWTTEIKGFDLRPGGSFHVVMRGPEGEAHDLPGLFLLVEPGERIIFTSQLVDGWQPHIADLPMTAIINFADDGDATHYTARVLHKDQSDRDRHDAMGFEGGWGTVAGQLEAYAKGLT